MIEKRWLTVMSMGRLGYNPDLPAERFPDLVHDKFPQVDKDVLYEAWTKASRIPPLVEMLSFHSQDFSIYTEMCVGNGGFRTIQSFIDNKPQKNVNMTGIADFAVARTRADFRWWSAMRSRLWPIECSNSRRFCQPPRIPNSGKPLVTSSALRWWDATTRTNFGPPSTLPGKTRRPRSQASRKHRSRGGPMRPGCLLRIITREIDYLDTLDLRSGCASRRS